MPRNRLEILDAVMRERLAVSVTVCKQSSEMCNGLPESLRDDPVEKFDALQGKELFRTNLGPKIALLKCLGVARPQPMFCSPKSF